MAMIIFVVALVGFSTFTFATSPGINYGKTQLCNPNGFGFNAPQTTNPCKIGPSYWCLPNSNNIAKCNLDWVKNVGVCGYSSGLCPVVADLTTFCTNTSTALTYGGGLINTPTGNVGVLILAAYWAPSSCPSDGTTGGFCSVLTKRGLIGARTMQLHGLWPDFGSIYDLPGLPKSPNPKTFAGAYQGWSQYCSANLNVPGSVDYSQCHANGKLCPLNVTTQTDYDLCMVKYNVTQCTVDQSVYDALASKIEVYGAAYANPDFFLHEFNKHASCMGGYLTANKTAFFETALNKMETLSKTSRVIRYIHASRGYNISASTLISLQQKKSISRCNSKCELSELWFCYGVNADGSPTSDIITCGAGNLASESCKGCTGGVAIPDYDIAGINYKP